ncbi:MAG TPA: PLP-dependent aminotransferase family protein [Streptosporangiaceae bacterium]|nr:PLP-dependent aminotransferase family protein [Streptosporangiaceae bacterium]
MEDALRVAIRSGRLAPGSVLPPSRDLAHQLGVSRGVVVGSYAQLTAEGYLATRPGSGTRVARLPETGSPPPRTPRPAPQRYRYDLRPGQADYHAFPRARWKTALLQALRDLPDHRLGYAGHRGIYELRSAIAEYLARTRGVVVEPNQVVVCCAASQALTVIWDVLRRRGVGRVAIEDPGWRWQRYTAEHAGLEAVPVRVDADGLVVSELAAADVDAVVVTPAHQYPTGVVMTAERRSALLAWAHERQALIVEDDYDVEYRFGREPVASLQGLASDRAMRRRYRVKRTPWSARCTRTCPRSGSAGPRPACTCWASSRTARTSGRPRSAPVGPGRCARSAPGLHLAGAVPPGPAARLRPAGRVGPDRRHPAAGRGGALASRS